MDYGSDPLGNGKHKMVPSGDIVETEERTRRLDAWKLAKGKPETKKRLRRALLGRDRTAAGWQAEKRLNELLQEEKQGGAERQEGMPNDPRSEPGQGKV